MSNIKYRIGFGSGKNDNINADDLPILTPPFTADRNDIFADTTIRKADETK